MADFEFIDNSEKVLDAFHAQILLGLEAIGQTAEGYAKKDCPVDTGRLRNSIANQVESDENAVYIGTNVEYGKFVEYSDTARHTNGKAHFLRDAATTHNEKYKAIMKAAMEGK